MSNVKTDIAEIKESNRTKEGEFYVELGAKAIAPPGAEYIGSINLHIYKEKFALDSASFAFATQFVGDVSEHLAIEAAKELKTRMMARYGHTLKTRK